MPDQGTATTSVPGDLDDLSRSFVRSLRAGNRSERTIETYLAAITQLRSFLRERGMPTAAERPTREHVEA